MKSNSNERPEIFLDLGDGNYHYNYNVNEVEKTDESGEKHASFDYDYVKIYGKPTYEECVKAVIASLYDYAAEIALINKYQSYVLGLDDDSLARDEYLTYLQYVRDVKQKVKQDLNTL
ncbi:MAG: hypothetical protein VB022_10915 [Rikenellaceae bacterium]|nr:hypothetical protein [Rikenellaceae bacterium]